MKKNLVLSVLAAAGMLFATSCTQDDLRNGSANSDYIDATFTLATEDGIGTRATMIGDGTTVDVVACAVYDAYNQEELTELRNNFVTINDEGRATYSVRLAKGKNYRVAFFAYDIEAGIYNLDDMKNITISEGPSNMENRDAFTAYVDIEEGETMNAFAKEVTLTRPFAQLNLGVNSTELSDAANAGLVVKQSKIVVSNVYKAFSAYDNAVAGALDKMVFDFNAVPTQKLTIGANEYTYLAMNYILVGDNDGTEKSLTDIEFVWQTEDGLTNNPTTHFVNVPVQRNYRTNIVGKLLTSPTDFNVVIDEEFVGDKDDQILNTVTKTVTTAAELQAAVNNTGVDQVIIKLANNIQTDDLITLIQNPNVQIYIDGQGYDVDAQILIDGRSNAGGIEALTIKNVNFNFKGTNKNFPNTDTKISAIVHISDRSKNNNCAHNVTIEDCTFTTTATNVNAIGSYQSFDVNIFDCTADNTLYSFAQFTGGWNFVIDNVDTECGRGISLGTSHTCVVRNSEITASAAGKYGIRHDATGASRLTIENCKVDAFIPVVVRNSNNNPVSSYTLAFNGANTLDKGADSEYHVAIAQNEYDAVGEDLTPFAPGVVNVTGADSAWYIFKE